MNRWPNGAQVLNTWSRMMVILPNQSYITLGFRHDNLPQMYTHRTFHLFIKRQLMLTIMLEALKVDVISTSKSTPNQFPIFQIFHKTNWTLSIQPSIEREYYHVDSMVSSLLIITVRSSVSLALISEIRKDENWCFVIQFDT